MLRSRPSTKDFSTYRSPYVLLGIWWVATSLWWAFAFFPSSEESSSWLAQAKNACFGTLSDGLPDTYGWMLLILGPLSFLIGLFVTWPRELLDGWHSSRALRQLIYFLLAVTLLQSGWVAERIGEGLAIRTISYESQILDSLPENYPKLNALAPDFALLNHRGEVVRLSQFAESGKDVVLSFTFANCETVCPALVVQLKEVLKKLDPGKVVLLLVTLDPWRDRPSTLGGVEARWGLPENAQFLSGSINDVLQVLKDYNIWIQRSETDGNIDHPAVTYVINRESKIAYQFNNVPPHWIEQAFARLY